MTPCRMVTLLELLEANAGSYWLLAGNLGQLIVKIEWAQREHAELHDSHVEVLINTVRDMMTEARRMGLRSCVQQLQRLIDRATAAQDGNGLPFSELRPLLVDLHQRMSDELQDRCFIVVPSEFADLYKQSAPLFGKAVADAFPLATEDISEAGKCLALNRPTAAVFHLMRTMECAVQRLSGRLGITNPDRAWGILLSDISKKIEAIPKGGERTKLSEVHAHLYHVKEAWRNDTMHPKQTYTPDEARAIFDATKVFMGALAHLV